MIMAHIQYNTTKLTNNSQQNYGFHTFITYFNKVTVCPSSEILSLCPGHFVVLAMFAVILDISKIISGHVQVLFSHKPCYCNCD